MIKSWGHFSTFESNVLKVFLRIFRQGINTFVYNMKILKIVGNIGILTCDNR